MAAPGEVAEQLGVRYVLVGSVQRAGDSLRVAARLVDAIDGRHLWAERYDRELTALFALEDDIAQKFVAPFRKVVESDESVVIHCRAPESFLRGARCGRLNTAAGFATRMI